jgi:uncharacterized protein (DUF1684 family)
MRLLPVLVFVPLAVFAAGYPEWRANYEAQLKAPDGWLSVAGLQWLQEGDNRIELPAGKPIKLRVEGSQVTYERRQLKSDATEHPDVLKFGAVSLTII